VRLLLAAWVVAMVAAFIPGPSTGTVEAAAPTAFFVDQTGHSLKDPILSFWADRDGLDIFGLPVTEVAKEDGLLAQYFQYGYLKATKKSVNDPILEVKEAGTELLSALHNPDSTIAGKRLGGNSAAAAFNLDGKSGDDLLKGKIRSFYDKNDGANRFGEPLSENYVAFGKRIQWFEYGRLESSLTEPVVEVAAVGKELAVANGADTGAISGDNLAAFEARRFQKYFGDGTIPEAKTRFAPTRIMIPAIGVDATVEEVDIVGGVMGVPEDAWNVGWYHQLSEPGERTNVVMAGHRDWWGIGPVVFYDLGAVGPGDKIYLVNSDGEGFTYVVSESYSVPGNANPGDIVSDTGAESLTLITCGGAFNGSEYLERQILHADRI
jgi:LPXTG-site transpeptidase (sortase) family protein